MKFYEGRMTDIAQAEQQYIKWCAFMGIAPHQYARHRFITLRSKMLAKGKLNGRKAKIY